MRSVPVRGVEWADAPAPNTGELVRLVDLIDPVPPSQDRVQSLAEHIAKSRAYGLFGVQPIDLRAADVALMWMDAQRTRDDHMRELHHFEVEQRLETTFQLVERALEAVRENEHSPASWSMHRILMEIDRSPVAAAQEPAQRTEDFAHSDRRIEVLIQMAERYCESHADDVAPGVGGEDVGVIRSLIHALMKTESPQKEATMPADDAPRTQQEDLLGAAVLYTLTDQDVREIIQQRRDAGLSTKRGNDPRAGQTYPAVIVKVFPAVTIANLQVLLDGTDTFWATSRSRFDPREHVRPLFTDSPNDLGVHDGEAKPTWMPDARGHWTIQ